MCATPLRLSQAATVYREYRPRSESESDQSQKQRERECAKVSSVSDADNTPQRARVEAIEMYNLLVADVMMLKFALNK